MFNIKIGTLISSVECVENIPTFNTYGYESYELQLFNKQTPSMLKEMSEKLKDVLDGRVISALCYYKNPLMNDEDYEYIKVMIENAKLFDCDVIGMFAGYDPDSDGIEAMMPRFKERYTPLVKLAEDNGVRLAFENCDCGSHWYRNHNMAYCPEAWDLIFDAIDSPSLGLEWEPSHMARMFIDPIQNLRKYVNKVFHIHGKDLTIAWDIVREYGVNTRKPYSWDRLPGFGDTNWCDVFTVLNQNGFKGACDIEGYHDPVYSGKMEWTGQKTSVEYLKRCRGGIEFISGPQMKFR